jgi:hypothetical protein
MASRIEKLIKKLKYGSAEYQTREKYESIIKNCFTKLARGRIEKALVNIEPGRAGELWIAHDVLDMLVENIGHSVQPDESELIEALIYKMWGRWQIVPSSGGGDDRSEFSEIVQELVFEMSGAKARCIYEGFAGYETGGKPDFRAMRFTILP